MNKKNLAMAMAAITVVGSAAPVFAATVKADELPLKSTVSNTKYKELKDDLEALLKEGCEISIEFNKVGGSSSDHITSDVTTNNLDYIKTKIKDFEAGEYADITVTVPGASNVPQYDTTKLKNLKTNWATSLVVNDDFIKKNKIVIGASASSLATAISDKGGYDKYVADTPVDATEVNTALQTILPAPSNPEYDDANDVVASTITTAPQSGAKQAFIVTNSGASVAESDVVAIAAKDSKISLAVGSNEKDLTNPIIDNTGKITGFNDKKEVASGTTKTIKVLAAQEITKVVNDDTAKDLAKQYVFDKTELSDAITKVKEFTTDDKDDNNYKITLYPTGKRLQLGAKVNYNEGEPTKNDSPAIITLKSTSQSTLKDALEDLQTFNNSYSDTTLVAGEDRIETAIAISEKYYNNAKDGIFSTKVESKDVATEANNIVLVGSNAIVDGLVASPLAADKKAPLLLTNSDKLPASVKSEIKRVLGLKNSEGISSTKEVYIAGGVNSVSKDVEKELKDMGLKVTRLAGDDRYETSLKIADEIGAKDKAYVVGGTGLADAMSIASVASTKGDIAPIVVVDGKGTKLSTAAEDFLDDADVDIIGGTASVSKDMEKAIEDATGKTPDRYKGDDRQGTNAAVIKEYYNKTDGINSTDGTGTFFVAKDGSTKEDQLVDALAVAAVAGEKEAPIVLATDSISSDQSVSISKVAGNSDVSKSITQVGKGIADSVISKLKDLLDM
ncbi:S-layer protein SlpA [Clostridioides difficile]